MDNIPYHPTEELIQTERPHNISFSQQPILIKTDHYPDNSDKYVDTTKYDPRRKSLDIGYQRLRKIIPDNYSHFSTLVTLHCDANCLTELPAAACLPNIKYISSRHCRLSNVPYYPSLTYLDVSNNRVGTLARYDNSGLVHLDCSFNRRIFLPTTLKHCLELYISNNNYTSIDLSRYTSLQLLDCSDNKLDRLVICPDNIIELNIDNNLVSQIKPMPNITILSAVHNRLEQIHTFPKLQKINVSHNNVVQIESQPVATEIIASHNKINKLGNIPNVTDLIIDNNKLTELCVGPNIKIIGISHNPIKNIRLDAALSNICHCHTSMDLYSYIYDTYYEHIDSINISFDPVILRTLLDKLKDILNANMRELVFDKISNAQYHDIDIRIYKLAIRVLRDFYPEIKYIEDAANKPEFANIHSTIAKLCYKSVNVNIYFNGYHD